MMGLFEPQKSSAGPAVSLTVVALTLAAALVALSGSAEAVEMALEAPRSEQLWRFLSSVLAAETALDVLLGAFYLLVLMRISEAAKGSLFYAIDAALKVFLINAATLLLVGGLQLLCGEEGFLRFLLQLQRAYPNRGFAGLFTLEVFLRLTNFRATSAFCVEKRLTAMLLHLCFGAMCLAHCFRLELPATLLVAVGFRLPGLNHLDLLYKLSFMQQLDARLLFARRVLFVRSAKKEARGTGYVATRLDDSAEQRLGYAGDVTFEAPAKARPPRRDFPPQPAPPTRDRFLADNYEI